MNLSKIKKAKNWKIKTRNKLEVSDSTPFGRILNSAYKGDRQMAKNIKFFYYIDKGWQVKNE